MVARKDELRDPATRPYRDANPDQIKRDIDHTRAEMDETIDALSERLHPRHLLDDVLDMFRSDGTSSGTETTRRTAQKVGRSVIRQVKRHPMPSLLCGIGLAWLLFEEDEEERYVRSREPRMYSGSYVDARTGEPYDETYGEEWRSREHFESGQRSAGWSEKAKGALGKTQETLSQAGHSIKETASSVSESVSGAASRAGEWAGQARRRSGEWSEEARHRAARMRSGAGRMSRGAQRRLSDGYAVSRERFDDAVEEHPLAVGLGFLALGALVGLAIPRTRREDRMMGEQSDRLKHDLRERGEEMVERGKHAAQATMSTVKEDAEREGLTPGSLGEKLQHVASKTLAAAEEAAHEEGIAPSDLKEKTKTVAKHAKEKAKEETGQAGETGQQSRTTEQHATAPTINPTCKP